MRLTTAAADLGLPSPATKYRPMSERPAVRDDECGRQRQAELDAQAIMQGMAQARQRAEQLARTGR